MIGDSDLAGKHDVVLHGTAAGDAGLCHHDAVAADLHVVRDLHEVVDLRPLADDGVARRAAVHRGVGADLDVVSDAAPAEVGHPLETASLPDESEPGAAHARAAADDDPLTEERVPVDRRASSHPAPSTAPSSITAPASITHPSPSSTPPPTTA
jgi:hypothetical protein